MNETDSALVNEPHKIIQVLGFFKLMTGSGKIEKRKKKQTKPGLHHGNHHTDNCMAMDPSDLIGLIIKRYENLLWVMMWVITEQL